MAKKHPKMDRYKISLKQKYEIDWVIKKMKSEGITVTSDQVKQCVKEHGNGRRKVYYWLREM